MAKIFKAISHGGNIFHPSLSISFIFILSYIFPLTIDVKRFITLFLTTKGTNG